MEQTNVVKIGIGYSPRPLQDFLHRKVRRFNVIVCHRRFGKTRFSLAHLLTKAFENEKLNPNYAYVAPTYGQAERVAWTYLKDHVKDIPTVKINEAKLRVEIYRPDRGDKITIWLLGSENPDSIRGLYLDGVILDEYAQCDPTIWGQVVRPALSDRKGWAIFIGTPKGMNAFYDMYKQAVKFQQEEFKHLGWFVFVAKASITGIIDEEELRGAKMEMSEEEYEQEFECSFSAALVGAYYGKYINDLESQGRLTSVPYEPSVPVSTFWDLGIGDSTTIWFVQMVGREIRIVDYIENAGVGLEWYARQLKDRPYVYHEHWIPHDGAAKELGTGTTRQETLRTLGISARIAPRQAVDDGINAVRMLLPKCWFNTANPAVQRGVDCLRNYERKWDTKNKIFLDTPLHNWASHGADGFRVFATVHSPHRSNKMKELPRHAEFNHNPFRR